MSWNRYYVYLLTADGVPFYVGKGQGSRIYQHWRDMQRGCGCYRCIYIRSLLEQDKEFGNIIVYSTNDEHDAWEQERMLIAKHGATVINRRLGQYPTTELTGTRRHIAWARNIRASRLSEIKQLFAKWTRSATDGNKKDAWNIENYGAAVRIIVAQTSAAWWIEQGRMGAEQLLQAVWRQQVRK